MSVGKLNRKLFFQTQSRTSDGGGSQSVAFSDSFSTFGSIQPKRGQETQFGDQLEERITHIITIRFRTNVSHKLRIQYRPETGTTRTFNIFIFIFLRRHFLYLCNASVFFRHYIYIFVLIYF